jgi:hypothetical protein
VQHRFVQAVVAFAIFDLFRKHATLSNTAISAKSFISKIIIIATPNEFENSCCWPATAVTDVPYCLNCKSRCNNLVIVMLLSNFGDVRNLGQDHLVQSK